MMLPHDIADLAYRESGLTLVEEKISMIQSRLRRRLRALGIDTFSTYCSFVSSPDGIEERRQLISALTTNVSHFFRERHHFDIMAEKVFRKHESALRNGKRLRIWSAGCSNGQEATSIAITLLETIPNASALDIKILATDIDPEVIAFARRGEYSERMINGLSPQHIDDYFTPSHGGNEPAFRLRDDIRKLVRFNELNLLSEWPMQGSFDVIFCRNVVIYFDLKTQETLWPRFYSALSNDGFLMLGHSERIADPNRLGFSAAGPTCYQKNQH